MWKGNRTRMTGSTGSAGFMKGGKVYTFLNLPEPFLKDWITGQARGDTVFSLGIVCFGTCCLFQIDWIQAQTVPEWPQSARDDAVTNFSGVVSGLSVQLSQCRIRFLNEWAHSLGMAPESDPDSRCCPARLCRKKLCFLRVCFSRRPESGKYPTS